MTYVKEIIIGILVLFIVALFARCYFYKNEVAGLKAEISTINVDYQNKLNEASAQHENAKSESRLEKEIVTKEIEKIVSKPIYLDKCIDDDGRMLINGAIKSDSSE